MPVRVAVAVAPTAVLLQSKAMAPLALVALGLAVALHGVRHRTLPWPQLGAAWAALALLGWGGVTALWAPEPGRAIEMAALLGGFVLLGAAAARAMADIGEAERAALARWAFWGLAAGIVLVALDAATGNLLRNAVRGFRPVRTGIEFGLKPAASVLALLLPLVLAAPGRLRRARWAMLAAGGVLVLALPGEAAKLAVMAALAAGLLAWWVPRRAGPALGALLAATMLLTPAVLGPLLARGVPAGGLPASAVHRLLIWDFAAARIAERPVLGWGLEASRTVPGSRGHPEAATVDRFGVTRPDVRQFLLTDAELLPLHPHNGALQVWLELGLPGAALAAALALLLGFACARAPCTAAATAALASGSVTGLLSFGAWQEWWVGALLLTVTALAGLPRRV